MVRHNTLYPTEHVKLHHSDSLAVLLECQRTNFLFLSKRNIKCVRERERVEKLSNKQQFDYKRRGVEGGK